MPSRHTEVAFSTYRMTVRRRSVNDRLATANREQERSTWH